jgi:hypothetical protein
VVGMAEGVEFADVDHGVKVAVRDKASSVRIVTDNPLRMHRP